ncbi:MAG: SocA family protein, partial [Deltaproteobacteria bacterium]|nr:SocA family protein [Deltaproteobacteria bacterium]
KYEPEIDSGFNKLNLDKLFEAVKFFASDGVFKTKLCKLLFYADFKHFKDYAVSITGAKYVHLPHGPVPDKYEHYFAILIHDEKVIQPVEVDYADFIGEDTKIFKTSELEILGFVKSFFKNYSATAIRDFSHNEKGYKETNKGDMISYKYADDLQI